MKRITCLLAAASLLGLAGATLSGCKKEEKGTLEKAGAAADKAAADAAKKTEDAAKKVDDALKTE